MRLRDLFPWGWRGRNPDAPPESYGGDPMGSWGLHPDKGPCRHDGGRIAPDVADPDQHFICCSCGGRQNVESPLRQMSREQAAAEEHRLRVEAFEELKAWADSLPDMVLRLSRGEAHFAAIYEPATPMPNGPPHSGFYGMTVPVERIMEASGDLPEGQMDRFLEEFGRYVTVRPGSKALRNGRPNPVPYNAVYLKGKFRPEVYTVGYPDGAPRTENATAHLDYLVKARERLRARNLPEGRLFRDHALNVHVDVVPWWTMEGDARPSYSRMDRTGLNLSIVKVGIVL